MGSYGVLWGTMWHYNEGCHVVLIIIINLIMTMIKGGSGPGTGTPAPLIMVMVMVMMMMMIKKAYEIDLKTAYETGGRKRYYDDKKGA